MYKKIKIDKLSSPQINKLMKGLPVRVKCGNGQYIFVSGRQRQMLLDAKKRGVSSILSLDREQCELLHNYIIEGKGAGASIPSTPTPLPATLTPIMAEYQRELENYQQGRPHSMANIRDPFQNANHGHNELFKLMRARTQEQRFK
jgi:hypothetical protein